MQQSAAKVGVFGSSAVLLGDLLARSRARADQSGASVEHPKGGHCLGITISASNSKPEHSP